MGRYRDGGTDFGKLIPYQLVMTSHAIMTTEAIMSQPAALSAAMINQDAQRGRGVFVCFISSHILPAPSKTVRLN